MMNGKYHLVISEAIRSEVAGWDAERLIRQVCCPEFRDSGADAYRDVGAMFFHSSTPETIRGRMAEVSGLCRIPPLFTSDLECGAGNLIAGATRFTSMMGLCRTEDEALARAVGQCAAQEAGQVGFHWTLAPVADLSLEKDSPVVSHRSGGRTPDAVIRMVGAYLQGVQEEGMIATLKHFPGDGTDTFDQHLTTSEMKLDVETWRATQGRVFRELIEQGAMAVMPGHISFPAYDEPDPQTGLFPPATLSPRILVNLLREELGFEGLIVTDAINMGGVVGFMNYYDACASALTAGCDCLLFPRVGRRFYDEMLLRVDNGMLPMSILRDRAARMLAVKHSVGRYEPESAGMPHTLHPAGDMLPQGSEPCGCGGKSTLTPTCAPDVTDDWIRPESAELADLVSAKGLTLVRDRQGLVPFDIRPDTRILYVVLLSEPSDIPARMEAAIRKFTDHLVILSDPGPDLLFDEVLSERYDLVLCSVLCSQSYGVNVIRLHGPLARNMMGGWMKLGTPAIFLAHGHPFLHEEYPAAIDTLVNTYGDLPATAGQLLDALTGRAELKRL